MVFSSKQFMAVALGWIGMCAACVAAPVGPAKQLIDHFKMELIPVEGAWFKVTYGSADKISAEALPLRYGSPRIAGGAIYALVTREDFSALHKLKTDEIWHFYVGDPIELLLLYPDGRDEVIVLGADVLAGQHPQFTVPSGVWMGARPIRATAEAYGFFGTTMAPGFDYTDFEAGYRDELQKAYPQQRELIAELTRAELATRPAANATGSAVPIISVAVPSGPTVFMPEAMTPTTMAPGVTLRELIGRVGVGRTERTSIARFTLEPGKGTGMSYCKVGEEYFLIISGRGTAVVEGASTTVQPGSVVLLRPGVKHSLTAAADSALEFYAITTPAFSPDDYVPVK